MTTYRVVEVQQNKTKRYIVQRKGWFFWNTVQRHSLDCSYSYDLTFDTYELAVDFIENFKPYEYKVIGEEIKI